MYAMLDSKRKTGILLPASHSSPLLLLLLHLLVNIYPSGKVSEKVSSPPTPLQTSHFVPKNKQTNMSWLHVHVLGM